MLDWSECQLAGKYQFNRWTLIGTISNKEGDSSPPSFLHVTFLVH